MGFHETVVAEEAARFAAYAHELVAMQRERKARLGTTTRALHVKQHLGLLGELVIAAEPGVSVGLFAERGRSYPAYVRLSSGSSASQSDKLPDVRGFAIKLVGVTGEKIIAGLEAEETQDFLFIDQPSLPFRDPEEFMIFQRANKDGPLKLLPRIFSGYGLGRALSLLGRLAKGKQVRSFATQDFHTAAPIAFGEGAAKLALFPLASPLRGDARGVDALGADVRARLAEGPLSFRLCAQLFIDDQQTPIEDASVTWPGPFLELATLTLPRQDVASARGQEVDTLVQQLSFDPWHSLAVHRPLGAIMRARAVAYRASVLERNAAPEPKSVLALAAS